MTVRKIYSVTKMAKPFKLESGGTLKVLNNDNTVFEHKINREHNVTEIRYEETEIDGRKAVVISLVE